MAPNLWSPIRDDEGGGAIFLSDIASPALVRGESSGHAAPMNTRPVRLAVRALILHRDLLLLVNAWPGRQSDLWCAPGGGVDPGQSLPDNLIREVTEETGLHVTVGAPVLVNEFHDPTRGFHQVDVYFRCDVADARIDPEWCDPEGVVNRHRWVTQAELATLRVKPDSLRSVAWNDTPENAGAITYDPLELIQR